jgi:phosphate transport system substrate-binding protein
MSSKWLLVAAFAGTLSLGVAACGGDNNGGSGSLSGTIRVDGSSTVGPLTSAIAEEFQKENPDVKVSVGTSGTGGGFEKFCAGETDINDASRPIEPDEQQACDAKGITTSDVQVANDAITVMINNDNPVTCMSVDQLKQVWDRGSTVNSWSQIKGLQPPYDQSLDLFGPGTTSGTFDFFTEAINGEEDRSRTNYNNVGEDDNQTVRGVEGSPGGMGYAGYSYYVENQGSLKALQIKNPDSGQCVGPSKTTVQDGSYAPLSRPLFVYPADAAAQRPEVKAFLEFYLDNVNTISGQAGFIEMTSDQLSQAKDDLSGIVAGGAGGGGGTTTG